MLYMSKKNIIFLLADISHYKSSLYQSQILLTSRYTSKSTIKQVIQANLL